MMISKTAIYHKSSKGAEAIATRQHGLTPRQRSLLILVDGKRGVDELEKLSGAAAGAQETLLQLLEGGFIEELAGAQAPAGAAAPAAAAVAPVVSLKDAQRHAARRLTDLMGPNAEELCLRIEAARNVADFNAAVTRAESVLRNFGGSQLAERFLADIQSHRPAA
jgi:hypothetical protein